MRSFFLCTALLSVAILAGCGRRAEETVQAPPPPPASAWVQADSTKVADELVGEMLKRPWVGEFKERTGRVPKVALGEFSDRSKGDVDLANHRAELARALAVGGVVQVLATTEGADFILKGAVGSNDGTDGDVPVKRYQIDLTLADAKTGDVATPTLSIEKQKDDRAPAAAPVPVPTAKPAATTAP
jgi:Peptidoglycan-synthase activator LpoB